MNLWNGLNFPLQIAKKIKSDIICGVYRSGMELPSIRKLAKDIAVNPNTMQREIITLKQESLLIKRSNQGFFITSDTAFLTKIKLNTATHLLNDFLHSMYQIGYNDTMIHNLITPSQNS